MLPETPHDAVLRPTRGEGWDIVRTDERVVDVGVAGFEEGDGDVGILGETRRERASGDLEKTCVRAHVDTGLNVVSLLHHL